MGSFAAWLRRNSEEHLIAATQADLARRYLGRDGPLRRPTQGERFWQQVFLPVYRVLPWQVRRLVLHSLPGSHRRRWRGRP